MKTIYALIGSYAGDASHTACFSDRLALEIIKRSETPIRYVRKTADLWNIDFCRSCGQCFSRGMCSLSGRDGMQQICDEILNADFLIIGTPIYAASMSGSLKNLIDRLSLWLHTMPLIGKTCAIITTASTNHVDACIPYLTEILGLMGAAVAACGSAYTGCNAYPMLSREKDMKPLYTAMATSMLDAVGNSDYLTEVQKSYFVKQNNRYRFMKENAEMFSQGEVKLWEELGYLGVEEMEDIVGRMRGNMVGDSGN